MDAAKQLDCVRWRALPAVALAPALLMLAACGRGAPPAPPQPIAFNHARHAAQEIECLHCHHGASKGARAGIPALADCASCHFGTISRHPEIKKVLEAYANKQPILWRKVNVMPRSALVHFKHKPHVRAGIDCAVCHGDVASMTIVRRVINTADMGFCVDCHRSNGASIDCLTCHH